MEDTALLLAGSLGFRLQASSGTDRRHWLGGFMLQLGGRYILSIQAIVCLSRLIDLLLDTRDCISRSRRPTGESTVRPNISAHGQFPERTMLKCSEYCSISRPISSTTVPVDALARQRVDMSWVRQPRATRTQLAGPSG